MNSERVGGLILFRGGFFIMQRWWSTAAWAIMLAASITAPALAEPAAEVPARRAVRTVDLSPGGRSIRAMAFFPDGKSLAARHWDGPGVWIGDVATGKRLIELQSRSTAERPPLAISGDGKLLIEGPSIWALATHCEIFGSAGDPRDAWAISADGTVLAHLNAKGLVRLLDRATARQRLQFQSPHQETLNVSFTADGQVLATSGWVDRNVGTAICLWDTATGKLLRRLDGFRGSIDAVVFSPDGSLFAVGGEVRPVRLFETATGKQVRECEGLDGMIQSVAFSPDGRFLATAGGYSEWKVHLLEVATGKQIRLLRTVKESNVIGCVAFAPDGRHLALADKGIRVLSGRLLDLAVEDQPPPGAVGPRDLPRLWAALGGNGSGLDTIYRAMWTLGACPDQSVPFLRQQLRPVPPVDEGQVKRLIADLDSDRFAVREQAANDLQAIGRVGAPALRQVLAGRPTLELRLRAERLLAKVEAQEWTAEELQTLRGLQVLEHIGTPAACRVLQTIAGGAKGMRCTAEATRALARLVK